MKTDINIELFKRYQPSRKREIIESLSTAELFAVTEDTVKRIIKEAGRALYKSRDKELRLSREYETGNRWNSTIETVSLRRNRLYIQIYIQMDSTDTTTINEWNTFFKRGEYVGKAYETNRYGDRIPNYSRYTEEDKVRFMRSLLYQYVQTKQERKTQNEEKQEADKHHSTNKTDI